MPMKIQQIEDMALVKVVLWVLAIGLFGDVIDTGISGSLGIQGDKCLTSKNSQGGVNCRFTACKIHAVKSVGLLGDDISSLKDICDKCTFGNGHKFSNDCDATLLKVRELNLSRNRITRFPNGYFCHLPALISLDISGNSLSDTRHLGFCDTTCTMNFRHLIAVENAFETVSSNSFCGLDRLIHLDLSRSEVVGVEIDAFVPLRSLQSLNLSRNHISNFEIGIFRHQEKSLVKLDLSRNRLQGQSIRVLTNLRHLTYLDLGHNRIDAVPFDVSAGMKQLRYLNLQGNLILSLQGVVTGLTKLEKLLVNWNNISLIHREDVANLHSLVWLSLSNNQICAVESGAFDDLNQLIYIDLDNNCLTVVPQFNSLSNLQTIRMNNNQIEDLKRREFENLTRLTHIFMSENRISRIDIGTFDKCDVISTIDLSSNRLTNVTNVFANCKVKKLTLNHNKLKMFSFADFSLKLNTLSVTHNVIDTIIKGSASIDMKDPEQRLAFHSVNLSHNRLDDLNDVIVPVSVSIFDLRNNNIKSASYTLGYSKNPNINSSDIGEVHLENNDLEVICQQFVMSTRYYFGGNPIRCSCKNHWLVPKLVDVQTKSLIEHSVADLDILTCQSEFHRLGNGSRKILDLDPHGDFLCGSKTKCSCDQSSHSCNFKCPRPCSCFTNANISIVHVDCSTTKNITNLPLTDTVQFGYIADLYVYFDGNSIFEIDSTSFDGFHGARHLFLNRTGLSLMKDGAFDDFTSLEVLHLENNNLTFISKDIFMSLSRMSHLYLSHNRIRAVDQDAFSSKHRLKLLHLDNNQLVRFSGWQLEHVTTLKSLRLHANKWSCDCQHVEMFGQWLRRNSHKVEEINQLFCEHFNGTKILQPLINFNSSNCHNNKFTHIDDHIEIWGSIVVIFVIWTIVTVVVFNYRLEVQVLMYSRFGFRLFNQSDTDGKIFDAFVSYSCLDEDFLAYKLLPGLESIERPYNLCLHHRHFVDEAGISPSVIRAVQHSSRTVILLSDNFIQSEWCRFEFQQAFGQLLRDRCNTLLVVVIDEVPSNLDLDLKVYLENNAYLKWGDKMFWEKLHFALPDRKHTQIQLCK